MQKTDRIHPSRACITIIACTSDIIALRSAAPAQNVEILEYRVGPGDEGTVLTAERGVVDVHFPDRATVLLLALTRENLQRLSTLAERLRQLTSVRIGQPALLDRDKLPSVLPGLLGSTVLQDVQDYARYAAGLAGELALLRAAHAQLQSNFERLEAYVAAANMQQCSLSFENPAVPGEATISTGTVRLMQILPVSTLGLSVIQIHLPDHDARFDNWTIQASLATIEDREVVASWTVTPADVQQKWLTLTLKRSLDGYQRTPVLNIQAMLESAFLPSFSLGQQQPLTGFCAYCNTEATSHWASEGRSLALRLWRGLPGVRPPITTRDSVSAGEVEPPEVFEATYSLDFLTTVTQVSTEWQPTDFSPVSFVPEVRGLLVHPPPTGSMWARSLAPPEESQPSRASVIAMSRNPEAGVIEMAFGYSEAPALVEAWINARSDLTPPSELKMTTWRKIAPADQAPIHLYLESGTRAHGAFYFASRMVDGAPNAFGWATFCDMRILSLGDLAFESFEGALVDDGEHAPLTWKRSRLARRIPYPVSQLRAVEDVLESSKETPVAFESKLGAVFCHPPLEGITLAKLSWLPRRVSTEVSATSMVGNEQAEPIEFCICASSLRTAELLRALDTAGPALAPRKFISTGWVRGEFGNPKAMSLALPADIDPSCALYLATRMSPGSRTNDYAWAYFSNLTLANPGVEAA